MGNSTLTRRSILKGTGAASLLALAGSEMAASSFQEAQKPTAPLPGDSNRAERMKWWKAARFGMFVHFGVYSTIGRHEWVMEDEGIPLSEYVSHASTFCPQAGSARAWA